MSWGPKVMVAPALATLAARASTAAALSRPSAMATLAGRWPGPMSLRKTVPPAITTLASAKGPSVTLGFPRENETRVPIEGGWSPSSASSTPALVSASLYFVISATISALGMAPGSAFSYPWGIINIMNRIVVPPSTRATIGGARDRHRAVRLPARHGPDDQERLCPRRERVDGHRVAQHVDVAVALREPSRQRLPFVPARAAAVHAQLALGRIVLRVALDRYDVDGVGLVRVDVDREPEVARQVPADLLPRLAGVVAAHDVPVLLHEEHARTRAVRRDAVNAVADLGSRVGDLLGSQAAVDRPPRLASVVGPEHASRRDRDERPLRIARVEHDRVQAHPT